MIVIGIVTVPYTRLVAYGNPKVVQIFLHRNGYGEYKPLVIANEILGIAQEICGIENIHIHNTYSNTHELPTLAIVKTNFLCWMGLRFQYASIVYWILVDSPLKHCKCWKSLSHSTANEAQWRASIEIRVSLSFINFRIASEVKK